MSAKPSSAPLLESHLTSLRRVHQGKVRDIYAVDDEHMLIVTTDRLSAFDVVLPQPIPGKGSVLTRISRFWFDKTRHLIPNHLTSIPLERVVADAGERAAIADRSMVVRKLRALPVEAVVRGYLIGSGWKDYQQTGAVCGIALPAGLRQAERLAAADLHADDQGADGRARRERQLRCSRHTDRTCPGRERARCRAIAVQLCGGVCARARHHHCRHQVRVRRR